MLHEDSDVHDSPDFSRETLGRLIREAWVEWALEQPNPQPSWVKPWEELGEGMKEVDRRMGERVRDYVLSESLYSRKEVEEEPELGLAYAADVYVLENALIQLYDLIDWRTMTVCSTNARIERIVYSIIAKRNSFTIKPT